MAVAAAVATLVAAAAAWALWRPGPSREIVVDVPAGASTRSVLDGLHHQDLLPSPLAGRLYVLLVGQGRQVRYGRYRIPPRSCPAQVLETLLDGNVEMLSVTVVEGSTLADISQRLPAAGLGSNSDWLGLADRVAWIGRVAPGAPSLEGFLFPDTYRFADGTSAKVAAYSMVRRFVEVWSHESASAQPTWGTPLQVVTLASMVEAETAVPEERARIAGLFLNRLRRGMLLQCDPTVIYALRRQGLWTGRLLRADLQVDDPYNTYRYPGLPPGPIDNPGRDALHAALHPDDTPYLYFVARPDGGHIFSRTLREHNRAIARLRRGRR
jgi:peptidoglycan lytic transglycosylase G